LFDDEAGSTLLDCLILSSLSSFLRSRSNEQTECILDGSELILWVRPELGGRGDMNVGGELGGDWDKKNPGKGLSLFWSIK